MATADCDEFEEQVLELALGGVDEPRRAELARHAAACPICHRKLEDLSWLGERLLLLAPEIEPPAGFESRVLDRLAASSGGGRAVAVAGDPGAGQKTRQKRRPAGAGGRVGTAGPAPPPPATVGATSAGRPRRSRRGALGLVLLAGAFGLLVGLGAALAGDRLSSWGDDEGAGSVGSAVTDGRTRIGTMVRADGSAAGTAVLAAEPRPHLLVAITAPRPRAGAVNCELVGADGRAVLVGSWTFADVEQGTWAVGVDPALLSAVRMDVKDAEGVVLASATFAP
jgi:hypothetical protein